MMLLRHNPETREIPGPSHNIDLDLTSAGHVGPETSHSTVPKPSVQADNNEGDTLGKLINFQPRNCTNCTLQVNIITK